MGSDSEWSVVSGGGHIDGGGLVIISSVIIYPA